MSIDNNDRDRERRRRSGRTSEKRPKNSGQGEGEEAEGREIDRFDVSDGCSLAKVAAFSTLGAAWPSHRVR